MNFVFILSRLNDIERATNAKCTVEQKQREEAKLRKENNGEWDTKVIGHHFYIQGVSMAVFVIKLLLEKYFGYTVFREIFLFIFRDFFSGCFSGDKYEKFPYT